MKDSPLPLRCPWFSDTHNSYEGEACNFICKTKSQLWHHFVDYPHSDIAKMLVELVAAQEKTIPKEILDQLVTVGDMQRDYIPISKIQAMIKEMEFELDIITNNPPKHYDSIRCYEFVIKQFKNLLPKEHKK